MCVLWSAALRLAYPLARFGPGIMTMAQDTATRPTGKVAKGKKPKSSHKDFLLFVICASKRPTLQENSWHSLSFLGPWAGPQAALEKWTDQNDHLLPGRKPRAPGEGVVVKHLCNHFLTHERLRVESGE